MATKFISIISRVVFSLSLSLFITCCSNAREGTPVTPGKQINSRTDIPWQAHWITAEKMPGQKNVWLAFRRTFNVKDTALSTLRIAADSKYWLWLNGKLVIFEGGLKRGPTPQDTYYDQINLAGKLQPGGNTMAVLLWYFGKEGMSHKSSGKAGLIVELYQEDRLILQTDSAWKSIPHPAYTSESADPQPNWRLPESNIIFDAREDIPGWQRAGFDDTLWPNAKMICKGTCPPWNQLFKRPIPFWKDYGLRDYARAPRYPFTSTGDTITCSLPYNSQVTPFLRVKATAGHKITMLTDHYKGGSEYNMRAEYITQEGMQSYESLGWINGHKMHYIIPAGIEVLGLKFRETGYNTTFAGKFTCSDPFYTRLWQKALRTLYVTMRDNYMDCPDRERAQWWGDVVLESGEAFYALDRNADALTYKGMLELMNWQRPDSTIFSPIPAGNWDKELPGQMLASVGYYGFYNYYLHTGDLEAIRNVYPSVERYLSLWDLDQQGVLKLRQGGWTWGDWGENRDMPLLMHTQYYLALEGFKLMSAALGEPSKTKQIEEQMAAFKDNFNRLFWQEDHYQSPGHRGAVDDRSQGLAVVSGLADPGKYPAIFKVLQQEYHASPYMEKYILEALFQMGYPSFALQRMKKRFSPMVDHPILTTLWEGWGIGAKGFGGGTANHAWSGGGLTLLSQYVAGVSPVDPGYETFQVKPQLGDLTEVLAVVPSVKGDIKVHIQTLNRYDMQLEIPKGSKAIVFLPPGAKTIEINGTILIRDGVSKRVKGVTLIEKGQERHKQPAIQADPGQYHIVVK